jgi:hypothetical protein
MHVKGLRLLCFLKLTLLFSDVNFTDCEEWDGDGVRRGWGEM